MYKNRYYLKVYEMVAFPSQGRSVPVCTLRFCRPQKGRQKGNEYRERSETGERGREINT